MPNLVNLGLSVRKMPLKKSKIPFFHKILPKRIFWHKNRTDKDKKISKTGSSSKLNFKSNDI